VIAPGKTARGRSDRVKTDRKDAELLARCLMAGSLTAIPVPTVQVEAARELTRAHDMCRRDLMNARHRVSKMFFRHGRVYPKPSSTWSQAHRQWLAGRRFADPISELAYVDLLAAVDGLTARKQALAERISQLAIEGEWWPTVARLRCFRGVDTLTALSVQLELSADWARFEKAHRVGSWLGFTPSREQSGESDRQGSITKTGSTLARRLLVEGRLAVRPRTRDRGHARRAPGRTARPRPADRQPRRAPHPPRLHQDALSRQAAQRDRRRLRPRARLLPLGRRDRTLTRLDSPPSPGGRGAGPRRGRHARTYYEQPPPARGHARRSPRGDLMS
jgi:transposase